MQDLALNFPTIVLLLVIAALAVLVVRRMVRKGLCDCGDHCGDGGGCAGCAGCSSAAECPSCEAAAKMVAAADKVARP